MEDHDVAAPRRPAEIRHDEILAVVQRIFHRPAVDYADSEYEGEDDENDENMAEYFDKMWNVYNTHSVVTDLESIQNAADEELCRHRCAGSIMDFSILCLNLDKKPKERQLKDKEYEKIFQGITKIFDDIYSENLSKDFEQFMKNGRN